MSPPNVMSGENNQPRHQHPADMELSAYLFNPVDSLVKIWEFFGSMFYWILRFMCVPAEIIFRRGFGERHFNIVLYFGGSLWLIIYMTGFINILPASWGFQGEGYLSHYAMMWVVGMIFGGSLLWHMVIRRFLTIDTQIHSRYDGNPLGLIYWTFPFTYDHQGNPREALVRQVYEPLFLVFLGLIVGYLLNPATGSFLVLSAFGMFTKELYKSRQVRNMILDKIDSDIIARQLTEVLEGKGPKETQGVYIAGMPAEGKKREWLKEILTGKGKRQAEKTEKGQADGQGNGQTDRASNEESSITESRFEDPAAKT